VRITLYIFAALAALGAAFALYSYTQAPSMTDTSPYSRTATIAIGTTTIVAEVADTDARQERGLGGRTELPEGSGMWFVFEEDGLWPFWMKDTLIPLDMIWVAADGTIITIANNVQPESYPKVFGPVVPARYVLEVPGGFAERHGIAEGQQVVVQ
jgi:uncharacterized protein